MGAVYNVRLEGLSRGFVLPAQTARSYGHFHPLSEVQER